MINTARLRTLLGVLGMLLPWIVLILSSVFGHNDQYLVPDSISATYYLAPCITPFMIILGSAGMLLVSYKGYGKADDIVCTIAGICAFGICLFPCSLKGVNEVWTALRDVNYVGTFQLPYAVSGILHNIFAISFFALLAFNSLFLFTKTSGRMTYNKKKRNIIYRVCGIGMILSFLAIVPISIFEWWGGVWIVETIALAFFGISWLTKADRFHILFADK